MDLYFDKKKRRMFSGSISLPLLRCQELTILTWKVWLLLNFLAIIEVISTLTHHILFKKKHWEMVKWSPSTLEKFKFFSFVIFVFFITNEIIYVYPSKISLQNHLINPSTFQKLNFYTSMWLFWIVLFFFLY